MVAKKRSGFISVVLPTYNEAENVRPVTAHIKRVLKDRLMEIIIVDDDSPDRTWRIVERMKDPKIRLIHRTKERGLASAIAAGVNDARGSVIVWMDCDSGIPPEEIPNLVDKLKKYPVAIGSRYVRGGKDMRSRFRGGASVLINRFAQLMLGSHARDYTSGFAAIRKDILKHFPFPDTGFGEYFIDFIYLCGKHDLKVAEVGYVYKDRMRGVSKSGDTPGTLFRLGMNYTGRIIKLYFQDKF
ncbi:MAG: glycosyltransferase [Nanoarchaeota archaeon]